MRALYFTLSLLSFLSCSSQKALVKNLDFDSEMNYIFSRINTSTVLKEELYNGGLYVKVFQISDSKATPKKYLEDFLSSFIISVTPDGDYYSYSKLYKIEGIYNPKILEIKETNAPKFSIKIEYGPAKNRKIELLNFDGVQ